MEAASKALDQSSHSRPRLSSMSSMKSIGNVSSNSEPDLMGIEGDDKGKVLSVPPLPLYALLAADKDTSGSGSATAGISVTLSLVHHTISPTSCSMALVVLRQGPLMPLDVSPMLLPTSSMLLTPVTLMFLTVVVSGELTS